MLFNINILKYKAKEVFLYYSLFILIPRIVLMILITYTTLINPAFPYKDVISEIIIYSLIFQSILSIYIDFLYIHQINIFHKKFYYLKIIIFSVNIINQIYIILTILYFKLNHLNDYNVSSKINNMIYLFTIIVVSIYITFSIKRKFNIIHFLKIFMQYFFFPIGIWYLQPELNKLVDEKDEVQQYLDEENEDDIN